MADLGATTNAISTLGKVIGNTFTNAGTALGLKLPSPNILSSYASYDYVISLSALTKQDLNYPDTSYKKGKLLPLICKSGSADPTNRVATSYGKFDFYIDQLTFESIIGMANAKATNVSTIQFDVFEPYSVGTFFLSLQTAAIQAGNYNWRDAPFLLTIEFRGNTETGQIKSIPFTARHIPIRFTTIGMKASEKGCKYSVQAYATQSQALTTQFSNLKTDVVIKGTTVQEMLQTGPQSLQAVTNAYLEQFLKDKVVTVADKIVILFPKEDKIDSEAQAAAGASGDKKDKAAQNPKQVTNDAATIFKKIGIDKTTLQQAVSEVNILGQATLNYTPANPGEAATGDPDVIVDEATGTQKRGKFTVNPKEGIMKFPQDVDIPAVINQVLMSSEYPEKALGKLKDGFRTWWRIDTQVFMLDSDNNLAETGSYPRIIVYRIIPFDVHSSKTTAPGTAAKGTDKIKKQIIKSYDYIYTGNNSEIVNFNIDFSVGFQNVLAASSISKSQAVAEAAKTSAQDTDNKVPLQGQAVGAPPNTQYGSSQNMVKRDGTSTAYTNEGGSRYPGSPEAQVAAEQFHKAMTNPNDMVVLELDIWGDPYWIVNSGMGNYTSKPVLGLKDLCQDGSVNWQSSEVHTWVNFRSPIDINQTTGFYDFKALNNIQDLSLSSKAAPTIGFTGLYCVNRVTSSFRQGQFRQTLKGFRVPQSENTKTIATDAQLQNSKTPASDKAGYATDGQGKGIY
jgi:hypothetical protein